MATAMTLGRQFDFWGGSEPYGPKPTGMKSPDVVARIDKSIANTNIPQSYRNRMADDDYEESKETAEMDDEPFTVAQPHPRTGLPDRGQLDTDELGLPHISLQRTAIHHGLTFHSHEQSQRRKVGQLAEIPLNQTQTIQASVSSQRFHEILDNPDTAHSPRYPAKLQVDVPFVHKNSESHADDAFTDYTVLDGNHRVTAAIHRNEMFTPARVVTNNDTDALQSHSRRARQRQADFGIEPGGRMNRYFQDS